MGDKSGESEKERQKFEGFYSKEMREKSSTMENAMVDIR